MKAEDKHQYWQTIIEQQAESGLSKAAFCRQQQIAPATFFYWSKKLREDKPQQTQTIIPVVISEQAPSTIEVQLTLTLPNGSQLAFPDSLDPARLQQFARALLL